MEETRLALDSLIRAENTAAIQRRARELQNRPIEACLDTARAQLLSAIDEVLQMLARARTRADFDAYYSRVALRLSLYAAEVKAVQDQR